MKQTYGYQEGKAGRGIGGILGGILHRNLFSNSYI